VPKRRRSFIDEIFDMLNLNIGSERRKKTRRSSRSSIPKGKDKIILALKKSKKVRREDVIKWLNNSWNANLPMSASWNEIANFIKRKVSLSSLERYAKSKGVI